MLVVVVVFDYYRVLMDESRSSFSEGKGRRSCPVDGCGRDFVNASYLNAHLIEDHNRLYPSKPGKLLVLGEEFQSPSKGDLDWAYKTLHHKSRGPSSTVSLGRGSNRAPSPSSSSPRIWKVLSP